VAPPPAELVKLLYRADRAVSGHPPLLACLLRGLVMIAIHPFLDGNGRSARMFWLKGLLEAGFTPAQISQAFGIFYGSDRQASRTFTSCACSGGTAAPFVRRWHEILASVKAKQNAP
jgi:Fic family protein